MPALGTRGDIQIDSFTPDGERLPPLLHHEAGVDDVIGTADAQASVLRLGRGALGLTPEADVGPIVIPGVVGVADPDKRADPFTLVARTRFAAYENPECGPVPSQCMDLNHDGDQALR